MNKYDVKILPYAYREIDEILHYISINLVAENAASKLADELFDAILSLEYFPNKFPFRRVGAYAGKGYRQFFIGNFTVVYKVSDHEKTVTVVTVKYSKRNF